MVTESRFKKITARLLCRLSKHRARTCFWQDDHSFYYTAEVGVKRTLIQPSGPRVELKGCLIAEDKIDQNMAQKLTLLLSAHVNAIYFYKYYSIYNPNIVWLKIYGSIRDTEAAHNVICHNLSNMIHTTSPEIFDKEYELFTLEFKVYELFTKYFTKI
ncbi:hypothetical protein PHYBLDRAFT_161555 [Phycomyces blakesleeanus NRRL 1555(-)]|uniref:Uncharacterized protein n=1 Tax=Phycomyces blakesleeanus (strain ATCC 8743b / DSM 1359 / FGSC 10004 / NBRC 33097 / NRRL 1555) TaxID=763407 RepID=A0A163EQU6_PHYB8|nr:hypothetical protein PHYBLDRAFT_161555 [Phycomyces blakesleeanus NRRL 1555(-)]OAD80920.1 hypothetical protein PHYBLDRAFT_161555 [Phycomyces blakesleeanus NRRL 1555(-)]|eukprot:XP_018298960.1 hypothetical protein PHYBLDRAFT_161555 [Phycomyces blakesleeanus NRRL 1555(-)]